MAAVMLQVILGFMQSIQKSAFSFLQKHTKNLLWAKITALLTMSV